MASECSTGACPAGQQGDPARTHAAGRRAAPLGPRQDLLCEAEGQDGRQDDQRGREVVEADSAVAVPPASREALSYRRAKPRGCSAVADVSLGAGGPAREYLKKVIRKPKPAHQARPALAHNLQHCQRSVGAPGGGRAAPTKIMIMMWMKKV